MLYPGKNDPLSNDNEINKRPMLLGVVRSRLRVKHYSLKTEKAYVYWISRYILEILERIKDNLAGCFEQNIEYKKPPCGGFCWMQFKNLFCVVLLILA